MPVETAADRAAFFNTDEFAVVAQIDPREWLAYEVSGTFDRAFVDVDGVESATPVFTCASEDLDRPEIDHLVVINCERFTVRSVQPSGNGITRLFLHEAD